MELRIAQFDLEQEEELWNAGNRQLYLDDHLQENDESNYSYVPYKAKQNPNKGHAIPFVTNHRYHIHWAVGLDFTQMRVDVSERWQPDDYDVFFVTNYTDFREAFNVTTDRGHGDQIHTGTLDLDDYDGDYKCGENSFNNKHNNTQFEFVINGKFNDDFIRNE